MSRMKETNMAHGCIAKSAPNGHRVELWKGQNAFGPVYWLYTPLSEEQFESHYEAIAAYQSEREAFAKISSIKNEEAQAAYNEVWGEPLEPFPSAAEY